MTMLMQMVLKIVVGAEKVNNRLPEVLNRLINIREPQSIAEVKFKAVFV